MTTERERLADLARRAYWRQATATSAEGWLAVADAVMGDRLERTETRLAAAEAATAAALQQVEELRRQVAAGEPE